MTGRRHTPSAHPLLLMSHNDRHTARIMSSLSVQYGDRCGKSTEVDVLMVYGQGCSARAGLQFFFAGMLALSQFLKAREHPEKRIFSLNKIN